jgi:predicted short-subunit dehydrogenase-like oxidoreductase (DUF2520 family)
VRVFILGAGKVGVGLSRAARANKCKVVLRAARDGVPPRPIAADLLILAVRDRDLEPLASELAKRSLVGPRTACVHVAGALGAGVLEPLRAVSAGVAQMHPMMSFASRERPPQLEGGHVHVDGDARAVAVAKRFARTLGMTPRTFPELDTIGYHAAAGLVANGAAALAAVGVDVLAAAGVPRDVAPAMLGPLLRSVAENVSALGFPDALTGPVRRGDPTAVAKHRQLLRERLPNAVALFTAAGLAQLPLARALGEAPPTAFDAIEAVLNADD